MDSQRQGSSTPGTQGRATQSSPPPNLSSSDAAIWKEGQTFGLESEALVFSSDILPNSLPYQGPKRTLYVAGAHVGIADRIVAKAA